MFPWTGSICPSVSRLFNFLYLTFPSFILIQLSLFQYFICSFIVNEYFVTSFLLFYNIFLSILCLFVFPRNIFLIVCKEKRTIVPRIFDWTLRARVQSFHVLVTRALNSHLALNLPRKVQPRDALHRKVFGAGAFPSLDLVMHARKDRGRDAPSSMNNLEQNERGSCVETCAPQGCT